MANLARKEQQRAQHYEPPVDVYESEKSYLLVLDVPGVTGKGIEVEIEKDLLKVTGRRESADSGVVHYSREFRLPPGTDVDGVTAKANAGVLQLVLPKHQSAQPKRIEVDAH